MGSHRLYRSRDGVRWSHKSSNNVVFSPHGELFRVDGTTVAFTREVELGPFWEEGE